MVETVLLATVATGDGVTTTVIADKDSNGRTYYESRVDLRDEVIVTQARSKKVALGWVERAERQAAEEAREAPLRAQALAQTKETRRQAARAFWSARTVKANQQGVFAL